MPKKILIIDDDVDMGFLLKRVLEKKDYVVEVAISGAKGLAKFNEEHFDLVLSDYRLGDKDGKEILKKIINIYD